LRQAGARKILVLNLPPLGQTPFFNQDPFLSTQFDSATFAFNRALETALEPLYVQRGKQLVVLADIEGLFNGILTKPHRYRLLNVNDSCTVFDPLGSGLGTELKVGVDPQRFLFWDSVHPTQRGHAIIAKAAFFRLRFRGNFNP
jgi:outer membrane lipase/esterase